MDREPAWEEQGIVLCYEEVGDGEAMRAENAGIPAPLNRPCQAALPFGRAAYTCQVAGVECELFILPDTLPRE